MENQGNQAAAVRRRSRARGEAGSAGARGGGHRAGRTAPECMDGGRGLGAGLAWMDGRGLGGLSGAREPALARLQSAADLSAGRRQAAPDRLRAPLDLLFHAEAERMDRNGVQPRHDRLRAAAAASPQQRHPGQSAGGRAVSAGDQLDLPEAYPVPILAVSREQGTRGEKADPGRRPVEADRRDAAASGLDDCEDVPAGPLSSRLRDGGAGPDREGAAGAEDHRRIFDGRSCSFRPFEVE